MNLEVEVTNTGNVAGKEVVQIYSGAPKCRLEMPKLQLRAFGKTSLLSPNTSETLKLSFSVSDLASYDEKKAAYVIPEGAYPIFFGNCIRSLEQAYTVDISEERFISQLKNRCVPKNLPYRIKAD